jgi:hypothetical protein
MENIFTQKIEQIKSQLSEVHPKLRQNITDETVDEFAKMIEPQYWDLIQETKDDNEQDEETIEDYMEMVGSDFLDREFMKYISEQLVKNLESVGVKYEDGDFNIPDEFKTELHEYYTLIKDWRQNHDLVVEPTVYGLVWDMYYSLDTDTREQVSEVLEEYLINK